MPKSDLEIDTFLANLTPAERRRLTSAVKIVAGWVFAQKSMGQLLKQPKR